MQAIVIGGFLIFLYIFFALTTSIYKDYKIESTIRGFESEIDELARLAKQKPEDVLYFQSEEYKDKYAKENLNLLNPGEKLIIIPQEERVVKPEIAIERFTPNKVLTLPNPMQWRDYFFGQTLSVQVKEEAPSKDPEESFNADQESLLEIEEQDEQKSPS